MGKTVLLILRLIAGHLSLCLPVTSFKKQNTTLTAKHYEVGDVLGLMTIQYAKSKLTKEDIYLLLHVEYNLVYLKKEEKHDPEKLVLQYFTDTHYSKSYFPNCYQTC